MVLLLKHSHGFFLFRSTVRRHLGLLRLLKCILVLEKHFRDDQFLNLFGAQPISCVLILSSPSEIMI